MMMTIFDNFPKKETEIWQKLWYVNLQIYTYFVKEKNYFVLLFCFCVDLMIKFVSESNLIPTPQLRAERSEKRGKNEKA